MAESGYRASVYVTPLGPTVVDADSLSGFFHAGTAVGGGGGLPGNGGGEGGGAADPTVRRTGVPQRVHFAFLPMCSSPNFSRWPQLGHSIRCMGHLGEGQGRGTDPSP